MVGEDTVRCSTRTVNMPGAGRSSGCGVFATEECLIEAVRISWRTAARSCGKNGPESVFGVQGYAVGRAVAA